MLIFNCPLVGFVLFVDILTAVLFRFLFGNDYVVGPCHHGMARLQVADGGTASDMEGSCKYIE